MLRRPSTAGFFRRFLAAGGAALVLALTVLAACPRMHDWLHDDSRAAGDDGCAVVLFSNGVSMPLGVVAVVPPVPAWHARSLAVADEILLAPPRYLRQPGRGPPVV